MIRTLPRLLIAADPLGGSTRLVRSVRTSIRRQQARCRRCDPCAGPASSRPDVCGLASCPLRRRSSRGWSRHRREPTAVGLALADGVRAVRVHRDEAGKGTSMPSPRSCRASQTIRSLVAKRHQRTVPPLLIDHDGGGRWRSRDREERRWWWWALDPLKMSWRPSGATICSTLSRTRTNGPGRHTAGVAGAGGAPGWGARGGARAVQAFPPSIMKKSPHQWRAHRERGDTFAGRARCRCPAGLTAVPGIAGATEDFGLPSPSSSVALAGCVTPSANARPRNLPGSQVTQTLSSDEFQGRAPGTEGETRTVEFLAREFQRAQPVARQLVSGCSLVEITAQGSPALRVTGPNATALTFTHTIAPTISAALPFQPYVEVANSEYLRRLRDQRVGWNDYAGVDAGRRWSWTTDPTGRHVLERSTAGR